MRVFNNMYISHQLYLSLDFKIGTQQYTHIHCLNHILHIHGLDICHSIYSNTTKTMTPEKYIHCINSTKYVI